MATQNPHLPPQPWTGRFDGHSPEHMRWHQVVRTGVGSPAPELHGWSTEAQRSTALIGFACDEGVRRNAGRLGSRQGPTALRQSLASLAVTPGTGQLVDAGDIQVTTHDTAGEPDTELEDAQQYLGQQVAGLIREHTLTVVLGGGHETGFATYSGVAGSGLLDHGARLGILNLDAHFDLRRADYPSSGTPFLQAHQAEQEAGRELSYAVVGISEANNTRVLFDRAESLGARWLTDEQSQSGQLGTVVEFVREFIAGVDVLYLTIDLDVLPAAVAPGVSAPAGFGVPYEVIHACVVEATRSGRLVVGDVVELNPSLDQDDRTAKAAARLIHTMVSRHRPRTTP